MPGAGGRWFGAVEAENLRSENKMREALFESTTIFKFLVKENLIDFLCGLVCPPLLLTC